MDKKEDNRIKNIFETTLENIEKYVKVNSIIGEPIKSESETIIPITNYTVYFLSGGGEYGKINLFKNSNDLPFTVGVGTIVNVKPSGFLVKNNNSEFNFINTSTNNYEKIIENITEYIKNA